MAFDPDDYKSTSYKPARSDSNSSRGSAKPTTGGSTSSFRNKFGGDRRKSPDSYYGRYGSPRPAASRKFSCDNVGKAQRFGPSFGMDRPHSYDRDTLSSLMRTKFGVEDGNSAPSEKTMKMLERDLRKHASDIKDLKAENKRLLSRIYDLERAVDRVNRVEHESPQDFASMFPSKWSMNFRFSQSAHSISVCPALSMVTVSHNSGFHVYEFTNGELELVHQHLSRNVGLAEVFPRWNDDEVYAVLMSPNRKYLRLYSFSTASYSAPKHVTSPIKSIHCYNNGFLCHVNNTILIYRVVDFAKLDFEPADVVHCDSFSVSKFGKLVYSESPQRVGAVGRMIEVQDLQTRKRLKGTRVVYGCRGSTPQFDLSDDGLYLVQMAAESVTIFDMASDHARKIVLGTKTQWVRFSPGSDYVCICYEGASRLKLLKKSFHSENRIEPGQGRIVSKRIYDFSELTTIELPNGVTSSSCLFSKINDKDVLLIFMADGQMSIYEVLHRQQHKALEY